MVKRYLLKLSKITLIALIFAYCAALAYLFVFQRNYLFVPSTLEISPQDVGLPEAQVIKLKTHDGETLIAWWIPPKDHKDVSIFLHGNADRLDQRVLRFKDMIKNGNGVFALSYRGYGGSTGAPSERGFYEDARTAYEWLNKKVSSKRIIIHGYSIGTGVATRLSAEKESKALVLEAPFLSAIAVAQQRYSIFPVSWLMWDTFRSDQYIQLVHTPVIILHGSADRTIPLKQAYALYQLALEPKQIIIFEGGEHTNLGSVGALEAIQKFIDKITEH